MRENGFTPLTESEGLGALLARSHDAPVLLFLHDDFCPISGRAYEEMREVLRLPDAGATPTMLVDVRRDRAVSRAIEAQTGVRHESPGATRAATRQGGLGCLALRHYRRGRDRCHRGQRLIGTAPAAREEERDMEDAKTLVAREREAYLILNRIRDARAALPEGHPAALPLDEAVALAENYWRELRVVVEALEQEAAARERAGDQQRGH